MHADPSFEQALLEFSRLLVPLPMELGAPAASATAGNILAAVKPFAFLLGLNFLTFALVYCLGKIVLSLIGNIFNRFLYGLVLGQFFFRRHIMKTLRRRLLSHRGQKRAKRPTRIIEDDNSFKSWEQFSKGTVYWRFGGELSNDVRHALNVLGVHAFSTENEIRKAYLNLMKRYHPDHFMQASRVEMEKAQSATVQIREAYDKITRQFCQVQ